MDEQDKKTIRDTAEILTMESHSVEAIERILINIYQLGGNK